MADPSNDLEVGGLESLTTASEGSHTANSAPSLAAGRAEQSDTVSLLEETLRVSKRMVKTGSVRVSTRTESHEALAEIVLERSDIEITRVPIDRFVDEAPPVRIEGDTTIVSVLEERSVVVTRLVVVEEVHIRRRVEHEMQRVPIVLRRQHADVARFDADGRPKS